MAEFLSITSSFTMPFPRLGWDAGVKPPDKDDLTTTPYGIRFLDLVHRNFSQARRRDRGQMKDVPEYLRKYRTGPGQIFIPWSRRAFWSDRKLLELIGPWVDAFEQVDRTGDKEPLLDLLTSGRQPPPEALFYFADLLRRYELTKPAHRPRAPAYDLTDIEAKLAHARSFVRAYQRSGMSFADAVAMAAKECSVEEINLANHCSGRRGASNRKKKRLPPLSP
jgi:hypothetical protein